MKKTMKKLMACMLACLQLGIGTMLTVSAAPTVSEADFDGKTITNPTSASDTTVLDRFRVKGLSGEAISDTDTTKWAAKTVSQVDDPISNNGSDRALRFVINPHTQSGTWEIYRNAPEAVAGSVYIWEFSIMLTGRFNNKIIGLNSQGGGKWSQKKFLQFIDGSGDAYGKVQIKDLDNANNLKTVEYNQWYNIKTVLDYTSGKEKALIYINGELFKEVSLVDFKTTYPSVQQAVLWVYNSDKDSSERYMYIDDWKYYATEAESSFEITDYTNAVFMSGSQVDFKSNYYLGADMEYHDLEKVEYYDNGVKVGESSTAPYDFSYVPQSAGLHTVSAKGYISEVGGDDPIVEDSTSFVLEQGFTESVQWDEDFEELGSGVNVDDEHGLSYQMSTNSGALYRASGFAKLHLEL